MLESLVITFREGMEAFLIIAVCMAYLKKTGRVELLPAVYAGIAVAVVASGVLGVWIESVADNPVAEGGLAMVAGVLVASLTVHMMKAAKTIGHSIRQKLDTHAARPGMWAYAGVFLFVTLMITREGMETALMMNGIMTDEESVASLMTGAVGGLVLAAFAGWLWVRKSHLIHLGRFLQVTAIFLVMFSVHLFMYGFHELMEAQALPFIDNLYWHDHTEVFESGEIGGDIFGGLMIAAPLVWLGYAALRDRMTPRVATAAQ